MIKKTTKIIKTIKKILGEVDGNKRRKIKKVWLIAEPLY